MKRWKPVIVFSSGLLCFTLVGIKTISLFCVIMSQTESLETAASVSWRRVWLLTDELLTCSKIDSVSVALFELATVIQMSVNCPVVVLFQCVITLPDGFTHILTLQPVWTDTIRDMTDCSTVR